MSQAEDDYQSIANAIKTISIDSLEETIKEAITKALRGVDLGCTITSLEINSFVPGSVSLKLTLTDDIGSILPMAD